MKRMAVVLGLLLAPAPLLAQAADGHTAVRTARGAWSQMAAYVLAAAKDVPDSLYGWQPTTEVRTFGQQFAHVAGAHNLICGTAMGDATRSEDDIERTRTTKAAIIEALEASMAYCEKAYEMSDADAQGRISLFGMDMTKLQALILNATHDGEHYGNVVTYLRINGIVPPSSRPRS